MKEARPQIRLGLSMRFAFCLLIFLHNSANVRATPIAETLATIDRDSPTRRYIGGGFSTVFSGMAMVRGIGLITDSNVQGRDRAFSYALLGLGVVGVMDGVSRIVFPTQTEREIHQLGNTGDSIARIAILEQGARIGRRVRWSRVGLSTASSLTHLALYSTGKSRYHGFIWPGIFLAALSVYRAIRPSPAESGRREYRNRLQTTPSFDIVADRSGVASRLTWQF